MIFLTVGTQFPFDRLVRAVDEAAAAGHVHEEVFAQVAGGYRPRNLRWTDTLEPGEFARRVAEATALIAHAGIGTILTALDAQKPLLVLPRLKKYGEVVNDHQVATARKFAATGHVLAAYKESEIPGMLAVLESFVPARRHSDSAGIAARVRSFLEALGRARRTGRKI